MGRVQSLNTNLRRYDSELYAQGDSTGRVDVYRQNRDRLSPPHFVFSLTEDWTARSKPREWGMEVVLARLRAIDLWNSGQTFDDIQKENTKVDESEERDFSNNVEAFVKDFRRQFVKATDSVRTANMNRSLRKDI